MDVPFVQSLLACQEHPGTVFHAPYRVIVVIACAFFLAEMRMVGIAVEMVGVEIVGIVGTVGGE
jgi:hypothetical protein